MSGHSSDTLPYRQVGEVTSFLYLPPISRSIEYRAYLAALGSRTLLEWTLEQLGNSDRELRIAVLCGDEPRLDVVAKLSRNCGIDTVRANRSRLIEAFAEAARQARTAHAAFFTLEACLAPSDLLSRACQHHLACRNDYTAVTGLPENSAPAVYATPLLV